MELDLWVYPNSKFNWKNIIESREFRQCSNITEDERDF